MTEIRYKAFEEFKSVFNRIASLERTSLCACDYEKYWQGDVEVQILHKPNDFPVKDLFDLNGNLIDVSWTLEGAEGWGINPVYWAYLGTKKERPHFNYKTCIYTKEHTSEIIRKSLHTLDDLIKDKECNLLVSHQWQDEVLNFFNLAIPARKIIKNPYR